MLKCSRHQTIHGLDEPLCCSSDHRGQTGLQSRQLGDSLEPVHCVVLRPLGRLLEFSQGGTDARQGQAGLSASESRGRQGRGLHCLGRGEGGQGRAVLYGASRLDSDRPLYSTYGPVTTVNVIQDKTVSSYNTESHRWDHLALAGNVVGSSWLPLSDSRIVSHGDGYVSRVRDLCIIVTGPIPTLC